jgi:hypothetical protein
MKIKLREPRTEYFSQEFVPCVFLSLHPKAAEVLRGVSQIVPFLDDEEILITASQVCNRTKVTQNRNIRYL